MVPEQARGGLLGRTSGQMWQKNADSGKKVPDEGKTGE